MELYEASYYGLLERIPTLLTSVSVDAANAVSMKSVTARTNPDLWDSNQIKML